LGKVSHEVGITFKADPPFAGKYPAFLLHPVPRFFLPVAPFPILKTVFSDSSMTYNGILIISFYKQYWFLLIFLITLHQEYNKKYTYLSKSNSLNKLNPAELRTLIKDSTDNVRLIGEYFKAK